MKQVVEEERILGLVLPTGALRISSLGLGTSGRRALKALVAQGALAVRGGVVHLPDASEAIIAARQLGGVLTCGSALARYDLPQLIPALPPHVAVPANRGRASLPGVCVHREVGLELDQPVVDVVTLTARLLRCAPAKEAIAITDAVLRRELATYEEIEARLSGRGNGCPEARRRLARCSRRARSPIESLARVELEDAGHTAVPGVVVRNVGEVDLLVDGRLFVETDGYTFHSLKPDWRRDRHREQQLIAQGHLWVRLTYEDVMGGRSVPLVEAALTGLDRRLAAAR